MATIKQISVAFIFSIVILFSVSVTSKIVLPHKLRYLENMLNTDVVARAAKIRQQMDANPNMIDSNKGWPMVLAKYQAQESKSYNPSYNRYYKRPV